MSSKTQRYRSTKTEHIRPYFSRGAVHHLYFVGVLMCGAAMPSHQVCYDSVVVFLLSFVDGGKQNRRNYSHLPDTHIGRPSE